jgi:hypothetical protein
MGKAFAPRRLPLKPFSHLGLDDRAENVKAAAGLGINSVLFDTVEKTGSNMPLELVWKG